MKFSILYQSSLKQEADEIRCPYNQLGVISKFIKDHPDKRYIIQISGALDSDQLKNSLRQVELMRGITPNYTVETNDILTFHQFKEVGYNTFLSFPVVDWETFTELKSLGASDIVIDGPLGFQMSLLKEGKDTINLRATPNISPNRLIGASTSANFFFIRPEDLHLYDDSLDTIFFRSSNIDQEEALFKTYKRGTFLFNLEKLIPQLNTKVSNPYISSSFGKHRVNCKQKCKLPNGRCTLCDSEIRATNAMVSYFDGVQDPD